MQDWMTQAVGQIVSSVRDAAPGRMSLREFVDSGLLQEANRLFFHPRGLALGVTFLGDGTEQPLLLGPILTTDDPEGWAFGPTATLEKTREAASRLLEYAEARDVLYGPGGIEPVLGTFAAARDYVDGESHDG